MLSSFENPKKNVCKTIPFFQRYRSEVQNFRRNPFVPNALFLYPLKASESRKVCKRKGVFGTKRLIKLESKKNVFCECSQIVGNLALFLSKLMPFYQSSMIQSQNLYISLKSHLIHFFQGVFAITALLKVSENSQKIVFSIIRVVLCQFKLSNLPSIANYTENGLYRK